jgi:hypothetical protein
MTFILTLIPYLLFIVHIFTFTLKWDGILSSSMKYQDDFYFKNDSRKYKGDPNGSMLKLCKMYSKTTSGITSDLLIKVHISSC